MQGVEVSNDNVMYYGLERVLWPLSLVRIYESWFWSFFTLFGWA